MELRVLNYFLVAAREENFTRAAEQLHVTQPTLSRQIADLEQELGVKLFTRSNHNIILTEDGMILKRRAQELLSLADKTKNDFLYKEENLEGTIAIGSGEFPSTRVLTEGIAAFSRRHPLVQFELYSGNAGNVREGMERGLLDVGLMLEPIDIRKYDFISLPVTEIWGAWVREDSALAGLPAITPGDLAGMPIITTVSDIPQSNIGKWLGEYVNQVKVIAKGNLLYNEALLAQSDLGIVIGMKLNCEYAGLKFVPFSPALESGTALVWKKEQIFSATVASFIDHMKKYIKGITNEKK